MSISPDRMRGLPALVDAGGLQPRGRASLRTFLRVAGSVFILGVLLFMLPFPDLVAALRRVPARVWVAAEIVYLVLHLIGVVKWWVLINAAGAGIPFRQAVRCYYYGLFGNLFLPSIVGGDVVRAGLAMASSRSRSGVLMGSVTDRGLDMLGLVLIAAVGGLAVPSALDAGSRAVFRGLMAAGAIAVTGAAALLLALRVWRVGRRGRRRLIRVRRAMRSLARQPAAIVVALLLGLLLQSSLVVLNAWLGDVVGIRIALGVWLFVWPLAKIAAVVPITHGGIGVREAAIVVLFQPFGVDAAAALATGLIFSAVVLVGGLIGGLLAFVLGRGDARPMPPPA
jgi:uncharacterized membrane protein YbhN (UPF0104 family)